MATVPPAVALAQFQVPTINGGPTLITIKSGDAFMVAGPNGVGKSALLYVMYRAIGSGRAEYYPGHRQITFNQGWDNLGQDIDQLRTNLYTNFQMFNRYKNHFSEDMFKSIVRRLSNMDSVHNSEISRLLDIYPMKAVAYKANITGPIDTLNNIFAAARMAVRFVPSGRGIRARRDNMEYDIDQLSDGERAALLIAGAAIVQDPYTIIAIDEPERNLHPSIAAPLVNAIIASRPDIGFLFASHDINLISSVSAQSLIYVKNSQMISTLPEMRVFDFRLISDLENISEHVKRDLLGSRQKILFTEGDTTSIDFQIYNVLLNEWKIAPKGGANQASEAVKTFRKNPSFHWFDVAGLIDRDGRSDQEVNKLLTDNINCLACPTIENLLFLPDVLRSVCEILFETEGGLEPDARMLAAHTGVAASIAEAKDEIVNRITTWRVNRTLESQKVSVSGVRENSAVIETIDIQAIKSTVLSEIESALINPTSLETLQNIPLKNTPIPARIVAFIGIDYGRYKKIVFKQLESKSEKGIAIQQAMAAKIPYLKALEA